jgi:DNA mismatch endonuclease, patch repair protein
MTDTFTKKQRSNVMRAVKAKGNKSTELKLVEIFKSYHITGWRRNYKIIGKPDFVFPKLKIALFADGCFWHGHNCRNLPISSSVKGGKKRRRKMPP